MTRDIFVSYSSKDSKAATNICDAIEYHGFSCWIAPRDVSPGGNFMTEIPPAIVGAQAMVLVFSSNTNNSAVILDELALAKGANKRIFPLRIGDAAPSAAIEFALKTSQWVDLFTDWGAGLDKVLIQIEKLIGRSPSTPPLAATAYAGRQITFGTDVGTKLYETFEDIRCDTSSNRPLAGMLRCLGYKFPDAGFGGFVKAQKFFLYGGYDPELKFTPLDFVATDLTFERDLALKIAQMIVDAKECFSAITLYARPGHGKSLALALIIEKLCNAPGILTFWSFDADQPLDWLGDTRRLLQDLLETLQRAGHVPRRVVFVFDDLPKRPKHLNDLYRFLTDAQNFAEKTKIEITILFSSADAERTFYSRPDYVFDLTLTDDDGQRLFEVLTQREPRIAETKFASAKDILMAYPLSRDLGDDVQSLIDLVISKSVPMGEFRRSWFSDMSEETTDGKNIVTKLAASQIFDLAVPTAIVQDVAQTQLGRPLRDPDEIRSISKRICPVSDDWAGYGLPSAYRAQMVLRHHGLLTFEFVTAALSEFFRTSLQHAKSDAATWISRESEYLRHLLQRLAKSRNFPMRELPPAVKDAIAAELFRFFGKEIVALLTSNGDARTNAKWAGTLSGLASFNSGADFDGAPQGVAALVCELCERATRDYADIAKDPKSTVPLLRASYKLLRMFNSFASSALKEAILGFSRQLETVMNIDELLTVQLDSGAVDTGRRVNELLSVYARFRQSFGVRAQQLKFIDALMRRKDNQLSVRGVSLDSGSLLEWVKAIAIRDSKDAKNIRRRAILLDAAAKEIRRHPREQANWKRDVDRSIKSFEADYGPIDDILTAPPPKAGPPLRT